MGKISKYSNIYDKEDKLIKHVDEDNILHNYTLDELEELVDKLGNNKDENGHVKDKQAFDNASYMLFQYYQKYGNPHEKEILEQLTKSRSISEQKQDALNDIITEYEEVKEA